MDANSQPVKPAAKVRAAFRLSKDASGTANTVHLRKTGGFYGMRMTRKYFRAVPEDPVSRDIVAPPATAGFPAGSQEIRSSLLCI